MRWLVPAWSLLLVFLAVAPANAGGPSSGQLGGDQVRRLTRLGQLWGQVQYRHPSLGYRADIDWDAALVEAIPAVVAAKSSDDYARAVEQMLARLDDGGLSRVWRQGVDELVDASATTDGKVRILRVRSGSTTGVATALASDPDERKESAIIVDLRGATQQAAWAASLLLARELPDVIDEPVAALATRARKFSGYPTQTGQTSGGYSAGMDVIPGEVIEPRDASRPTRLVFIVDRGTALPSWSVALHERGDAAVVFVGPGQPVVDGNHDSVDLGEGLSAAFLVGEPVAVDGSRPTVVPARRVAGNDRSDDGPAMRAARKLALARPLPAPRTPPATALPAPVFARDRIYADMALPSPEYRLLALFRVWNVIDLFYPYHHLIDWQPRLAEFVPVFWAAASEEAYARAILQLGVHTRDGHTHAYGGAMQQLRGAAAPGVSVRFFEHRPVIEDLAPEVASSSDLRVGDELVAVDDVPVAQLLARVGDIVPASNRVTWGHYVAKKMLRGADGSSVELTVQRASKTIEVVVKRDRRWYQGEVPESAFRLLDDETGYVHMGLLDRGQVDDMFARFEKTRAIIFDLRNYPRGTAWVIAPLLAGHKDPAPAAAFYRQEVGRYRAGRHHFLQPVPPNPGKPQYEGRVIVLVDERTQSQAEHTGLFFEAATGGRAVFVGTETAGANGDITRMGLPGGIYFGFTGHDVRHADGRQLQQVGLQPHVRVRPTVSDVRRGFDRVLAIGRACARDPEPCRRGQVPSP